MRETGDYREEIVIYWVLRGHPKVLVVWLECDACVASLSSPSFEHRL